MLRVTFYIAVPQKNPDVLTYERVNHNYKEKKRTLAISLIFMIWMFPNGGTPTSSILFSDFPL
jgi:hypothetical protein